MHDQHIQNEFTRWIETFHWSHFVTLAPNGATPSIEQCRRLLRCWDARMNRRMLGPKWSKRPDERLFAIYFLEKPDTNPHWHALIRLFADDSEQWRKRHAILCDHTQPTWHQLVRSGTSNVKMVTDRAGICRYVAKQIRNELCYSSLITSREFV